MKYKVVTTLEQEDLIEKGDELVIEVWPEFMLNDAVADEYFIRLYDDFPEYQYWLMEGNEMVGSGNSIPIFWNNKLENLPENGWDWALQKGFKDKENKIKPNFLCAMSITISPKYQGKGISTEMIKAMMEIGKKKNFEKLLVPVRPTLKKDYPLIDMQKYISWKREDGKLFDPWLRVHETLGGKIIKVCSQAMKISGSHADWESWTGMKFPESGKYIIPGALSLVVFDDIEGIYFEPNVWMMHQL